MGFLDRFRKKQDPVPEMLCQAIGDRGFLYDQDEEGIYVFDYGGLGMALDMTEHPFISVLYMDDAQCRERYGMPLDELYGKLPEELELSLEDSGEALSLICGRPVLNGEETDPSAFRGLLEELVSVSGKIDAVACPPS